MIPESITERIAKLEESVGSTENYLFCLREELKVLRWAVDQFTPVAVEPPLAVVKISPEFKISDGSSKKDAVFHALALAGPATVKQLKEILGPSFGAVHSYVGVLSRQGRIRHIGNKQWATKP